MSLGDMDQDGQAVVTMHRVLHEYAATANALSTYSCPRSRALMAREGLSCSHDGQLYKVHDHPHTQWHIYIYIYICLMHHAQCYHIEYESKQKLPLSQGYGPTRYKKDKGYKERGNPNTML